MFSDTSPTRPQSRARRCPGARQATARVEAHAGRQVGGGCVSTFWVHCVTRTESGFARQIMRFTALVAITTSPYWSAGLICSHWSSCNPNRRIGHPPQTDARTCKTIGRWARIARGSTCRRIAPTRSRFDCVCRRSSRAVRSRRYSGRAEMRSQFSRLASAASVVCAAAAGPVRPRGNWPGSPDRARPQSDLCLP